MDRKKLLNRTSLMQQLDNLRRQSVHMADYIENMYQLPKRKKQAAITRNKKLIAAIDTITQLL